MLTVRGGCSCTCVTTAARAHTSDHDGNQLSVQDNGDLYVERLGSDGRLDTAYFIGNVLDIPDVPAQALADRVEAALLRGQ